mgnify:CR=1 FL=1
MFQQDTPNSEAAEAASTSPPDAAATETPELVDRFLDLNEALEPLVPEPLMPAWTFLQDYPLLLVLVMAVLGYGVGKALQWFLHTSLSQAARRTKTNLDDRLIDHLTAPVVQTSIILGLVAATGLTRLLGSVLYGVSPTDPLTFGLVCLAVLGVVAAACLVPALRATRIHPMTALRGE